MKYCYEKQKEKYGLTENVSLNKHQLM